MHRILITKHAIILPCLPEMHSNMLGCDDYNICLDAMITTRSQICYLLTLITLVMFTIVFLLLWCSSRNDNWAKDTAFFSQQLSKYL